MLIDPVNQDASTMRTRWQIVQKAAKWASTRRQTGSQIVRGIRWPGIVLLVLTLYVGSTGPVGWLDQHGYVPKSVYPTWNRIYYPLRLIDHSPLRRPLQRYVKWWRQL